MCQFCSEGWRFETTELGGEDAGRVKSVLHPISVEWEDGYARSSTGSMVLATRDPAAEDIWSGATGIYISQVMKDGTRRPRFGGYIPRFNGAGGATTVAFKSIDAFLDKRLLAGPSYPYELQVASISSPFPIPVQAFTFELFKAPAGVGDLILESGITTGGNAALAAFLVEVARGGVEGPPFLGIKTLTSSWVEPTSDLEWNGGIYSRWWEFKNIGQAIRELVEAENGIKYRLEHTYTQPSADSAGYWSTRMVFSDVIGQARDYTLVSDREGWQYGLEVDAEQKATRVYGIGSGEEANVMFSIAYDADQTDNLPEHQVTVAWKDQTAAELLDGLTKGYVVDHRDPATVPSLTVVGMPDYDPDAPGFDPQKGFPAPEICQPGDTFGVSLGYGVITVRDIEVRNLGVSWQLQQGTPVQRTIAMQPVIRANSSVRTQVPAKPPAPVVPVPGTGKPPTGSPVSDPWPVAGKVVNVATSALAEISGMEVSAKNPGYVWVHNDERETKQVSLVSLKNGGRAGTFGLNPPVSNAPVGDPESIRLSKVSGRLVLADTGDNDRDRPTSGGNQPHLLALPEPKGTGDKGTLTATRYPIAYPGGERINCESLLIHPTTDEVFLISKEPTRARVFSYGPLSAMSTTNNVGTLVATLNIKNVSDACHTMNGQFVLVLPAGSKRVPVMRSNWSWSGGGIDIPAMSKAEAITVESSCAFLVTTEGANAPIYRVLIPKAYGATCSTPSGGSGTGGTPSNPSAKVPGQLINMNGWKLQLPI